MATTSATTSTGTGAILQSLGIGSGIDVNSIVSQLVTADTAPDNSRIARETQQVGTELTAVGQLKGALSAFQSALSGLSTQADFQTYSATSSDNTVFTANATTGAVAGTYNVEVVSLAQAQQLLSGAFSGGSTAVVGTGVLTLSVGSNSFNVQIDSTNNTLAGIRDAINKAADNTGISAAIVNGTGGAQLVLSSSKTGAANTVTVAATSSDGLSRLDYNASLTSNYTQLQGAQDSEVNIAGVQHKSTSNSISDAVDGVTLNLLDQKPGTTLTLTIANDANTVAARVQNFVSAYNTLKGVIASVGGYDAASNVAGPLFGESFLTNIDSQLRRGVGDRVASAPAGFNSLANIGITTNQDGTLSVDNTKLTNALQANFASVGQIFGASDGVAARLSSFLTDQLSSTGGIAVRNQTLVQQQQQISDETATVQARAQQLTQLYQAQFTAMDTLLAQLQQTSSFLTQQLSATQAQIISTNIA